MSAFTSITISWNAYYFFHVVLLLSDWHSCIRWKTIEFQLILGQWWKCARMHCIWLGVQYSEIFISYPEYQILLQQVVRTKMSCLRRGLECQSAITQLGNLLVTSLCSAMGLLSISFSYSGEQRVPLQNLLKLFVFPTLLFFMFI